jgi:hypothetical protein
LACEAGLISIIELMLEYQGQDAAYDQMPPKSPRDCSILEVTNDRGETPFYRAVSCRQTETAKFLLQFAAKNVCEEDRWRVFSKMLQPNSTGVTPYDRAVTTKQLQVAGMLKKMAGEWIG